jgi:hypothetical protein
MRSFLMRQQMDLLTLFEGFDIIILFYPITKFILLPVEIVLVVNDVIPAPFAGEDCIDAGHLSAGFNAMDKGGNDESISPKEGQQTKRGENGGNGREKERHSAFKQRIDSVDHPAAKDHDEKVLGQIIPGNDLKECGGGLLHDVSILSGQPVLPAGSIDFPAPCAASILPFRSPAPSHRPSRAGVSRSDLHR